MTKQRYRRKKKEKEVSMEVLQSEETRFLSSINPKAVDTRRKTMMIYESSRQITSQ